MSLPTTRAVGGAAKVLMENEFMASLGEGLGLRVVVWSTEPNIR
jgi:hypothetical protein